MKSFIFLMVIGLVLGVGEVKGQLRLVEEFDAGGRVVNICPSQEFPYFKYVEVRNLNYAESQNSSTGYNKLIFSGDKTSQNIGGSLCYKTKDMLITYGDFNAATKKTALKKYEIIDEKLILTDSITGLDYQSGGVIASNSDQGVFIYQNGIEMDAKSLILYDKNFHILFVYSPFGNKPFVADRVYIGDSLVIFTGFSDTVGNIMLYNYLTKKVIAEKNYEMKGIFPFVGIFGDQIIISRLNINKNEYKLNCFDNYLKPIWEKDISPNSGIVYSPRRKKLILNKAPDIAETIGIESGKVEISKNIQFAINMSGIDTAQYSYLGFYDGAIFYSELKDEVFSGFLLLNKFTNLYRLCLLKISQNDIQVIDFNLKDSKSSDENRILLVKENYLYLTTNNKLFIYEIF